MTEADAYSLVRDVGRTVTLRERPDVTGSPVDTSVLAAPREVNDAAVDGVTILRGDRRYLIPAAGLSVVPKPNGEWSIVEGTTERSIVSIQEHTGVGGAVIAYDCTARI